MAFTLEFLNGSISGELIRITASGSPGTIIHSGVAGATQKDELFLYGNNTGTGLFPLSLEIGVTGTGIPTPPRLMLSIAPQDGMQLIYPGLPVNNSIVVRGFCTSGSGILIGGYAQRGP